MTKVLVDVNITVDEGHVPQLFDAFDRSLRPTALDVMLGNTAVDLQRRAAGRFASEGDIASGAWKDLRPATQEIRDNAGFSPEHPINDRTGALRHFVTHSGGDSRATRDGAVLIWPHRNALNESKLRVAQQGSKRGANPLFANARTPPRPVVALSGLDVLDLLMTLNNHFASHMRGVGFTVVP